MASRDNCPKKILQYVYKYDKICVMEQTFARTRNIVRDTADTENLTDRELLARELDSARIAAARAYGLERMGIGGDQPELKQYAPVHT